MSAATDLPSAQLAVARIRETFTDKRNGKLKGTLSHELKRHLNIVLDPDNDTLLTLIINNFSHRSGSGSSYVDLLTAFKQHPINDGVIELAMVYIVGWTKKRIDELIEQSLPATIDRDDFWQTP
jgi:hypothetical protein